jgi:hypothetical protein
MIRGSLYTERLFSEFASAEFCWILLYTVYRELFEILFEIQTYLKIMTEKVSKGISSPARSCNSKRSTAGEVRVFHISNPTTMVEASESEFRAVVQSLTGRKRSSPSSSHHEEINLFPDNHYSPQVKAPKLLEGELRCLNDTKSSESALIDDNTTVRVCCNDEDHGDVRIFEELEALDIINPDYMLLHQTFETVESRGDTKHILFDIFSPPILFSEF